MPQLGPYCFRNSTDDIVDGLQVILAPDHGTVHHAKLTVGPRGRILVKKNHLHIFLDAPLASNAFLCFIGTSHSADLSVERALWTRNYEVVGPAAPFSKESAMAG